MEYDGCCSHSLPRKTVLLLKIAAKHVEMEQRRPEQKRPKQRKHKQTNRGRAKVAVSAKVLVNNKARCKDACDLCDVAFQTAQALNGHNASQRLLNAAAGIPKGPRSAEMKAQIDTNIANKTCHCKPCNKSFGWDSKLECQKKSLKHKDLVGKAAKSLKSSS